MSGMLHRMVVALSFLAVFVAAQRPHPHKKETLIIAEQAALYITPNIMTGLIVGVLWVTLFLTGFCCLFQVQTPTSYETKTLVLNKTY